jgi:hypothetical protein
VAKKEIKAKRGNEERWKRRQKRSKGEKVAV